MSAKDIKPYKGKRKALLQAMADPDNAGLDVLSMCNKAGISRESYYKYTKEPDFQQALKELCVNIYTRHMPQSVNSVVKLAKGGDLGANRLMHESLGFIGNKGNSQTVNVGVQAGETTTATYANDQEALEDIETSIKELKGYAEEIRTRMDSKNRLTHAIHPEAGGKDREEA